MAYAEHELALKAKLDPEAAAKGILAAYRKARCSVRAMAAAHGCTEQTMARWIRGIDRRMEDRSRETLTARLEKLKARAAEEGWHHDGNRQGGRPKGGANKKKRAA